MRRVNKFIAAGVYLPEGRHPTAPKPATTALTAGTKTNPQPLNN